MQYQDFEIQISSGGAAGFTARVLRSPAGSDEDSFEPPFGRVGLPVLLHRLNAGIRKTRHSRPAAASAIPDPREIGKALYQALFFGRVRDLYQSSVSGVGDGGLRIILKLNPRLAKLALIQNLPWELLARPEDVGYLALSPDSPIVRCLDVQASVVARPLPLRLCVLLASSQPTDLPSLDLEEERRRLLSVQALWRGRARLRVVPLPAADLGRLRQALQAEAFHVLHFMGHGSLDPESGEGSLEMMGEDGRSVQVRAAELGSLLGDFKSLRLVVLNACSTAEAAERESASDEIEVSDFQPFAGVAQALIRKGLPAVVAMQRKITDHAAIVFSEAFYRRMAAGDPVDVAVTQGRQAISDSDPGSLEWSTPALFMRTPDGVLFRKWPSLQRVAVWLAAVAIAVTVAWLGYDWQQRAEAVEHNNRGAALLRDGDLDGAESAFRRAEELDPSSAVTQSNLAMKDFLQGSYERAARGYRKAVDLDRDNAIYHYHLGTARLMIGERLQAVESFERAVELDGDYLAASNELAKVYRELERIPDARETLERALDRFPAAARPESRAPLLKNLGRVEIDGGRPAAAAKHLLEAHSHYLSTVAELAEIAFLLAKVHDQRDDSTQVCQWLSEIRRYGPSVVVRWDPREPAALAVAHGCSFGVPKEREE